MNNPVMPATTTQTMTAAIEREMFASWQRCEKLTKSNRNAAAAGRDRIDAAVTETAAMQTEATKAQQIASKNASFQSFREYKQWLAATGLKGSDGNAAADGRIPNNRRMVGAAAAAMTDTPSKLAAKITIRTTVMVSKTPSKDERRNPIPAERQDVTIGDREGVNCTTIEDCVVDGFILHEIKTTPTYSSILKKGARGRAGMR